MLLIEQIRLPLEATQTDAIQKAIEKAGVPASAVTSCAVHKISVDARRKPPVFVFTIVLCLLDEQQELFYAQRQGVRFVQSMLPVVTPGIEKLNQRVVVCGFGPAGLFAALALAQAGYNPLVLERGPDITARRMAVDAFEKGGALNPNANIQFGEGGAGTFSDGKLTTRIKDPLCQLVTKWLLKAGAPAEIATRAKPHIGTDLLRDVFKNLRGHLLQLGAEVRFNTQVTGFVTHKGRLAAVKTPQGEIPCGALVLAAGHSARDTFAALHKAGAVLLPKSFSVGFRAEHLQSDIDSGLYHEAAGHPALSAGEYQLSTKISGRAVYTFCMCPGGQVVAAASEEKGVVTNGMSLHARNGKNANAAVVAAVSEQDFGSTPFAGLEFQRRLEQAAYTAGGGNFAAPAQTLGCFLAGKPGLSLGRVSPSYPRGVKPADLGSLLPPPVALALKAGFSAFGRKIPGFDAPDTVLTGLETRTSSPVRLPRAETLESESLLGLWPAGEGAGYAGGIMSAATDGLRVAHAIIGRYAQS